MAFLWQFPGDKPAQMEELGLQPLDQNEFRRDESQSLKLKTRDSQQNHSILPVPRQENNIDGHRKIDKKFIDLNTRPLRLNGPTPNNQVVIFPISTLTYLINKKVVTLI